MAGRPTLGAGWTLWPQALLRGAGFPFALLDRTLRANDASRALREVAADPRFREAVLWQNRAAVVDGLDSLLRRPPGKSDARTRKKELLVARYLQRYCAKNDTIGFFGPVGWAALGGEGRFAPGPQLLAARATCFEPWAVRALAEAVGGAVDDSGAGGPPSGGSGGAPELRWWAPVSLPGDLRVAGRRLIAPGKSYALTPDEALLLAACDGVTPARRLVQRLGKTRARRAALEQALASLVSAGVVRWGFPVSLSLEPEAPWRRAIAKVSDRAARWALQAPLEALVEAKANVAAAAGDEAKLGPALEHLEATFETLTGRAPRRHEGRMYAGRGLVFEEARRDVQLRVGDAQLATVAPSLRVVLSIARWYTFEVARRLAQSLTRTHDRLGGGRVPLHVFWRATAPLFEREVPPSVGAASRGLKTRWARLWTLAQEREDGWHLDVARAEAFVARHFAAPCPGWPGARHHAPDLMWAASSADALLSGRSLPVLAELHPGVTPLTTLSVLSLSPCRKELEREWRRDLPPGLVSPIPWEDFARSSQDARLAASHWHLDVGGEFVSDRPSRQVVRAADFDVVSRGGRLWAVHRAGGPTFDLLVLFERGIKLRAATAFSLGDGTPSGPRRWLGPLVVQRAHWTFEALPFAEADGDRLEAVRSWCGAHRIPWRVFVRTPDEVKPVYVDLASALSVEQLVRLSRKSPSLSLSEMLPSAEHLWLADANDQRYVSELRCVAVDPVPYDGRAVWGGLTPPARGRRSAPRSPARGRSRAPAPRRR